MANSDADMIVEVREFGQYTEEELTDPQIRTALSRAKNHLVIEARLQESDWYNKEKQEEALFWTTMLFTKVQTGALDAKAVSVGAINESVLRSHSGGETTEWYRRFRKAIKGLTAERLGQRHTTSARTGADGDRFYEKDTL